MNKTIVDLTLVNLLKVFVGESQACNRYEYYAEVAKKEKYRNIVVYFQGFANNEKEHAKHKLALPNRMSDNS